MAERADNRALHVGAALQSSTGPVVSMASSVACPALADMQTAWYTMPALREFTIPYSQRTQMGTELSVHRWRGRAKTQLWDNRGSEREKCGGRRAGHLGAGKGCQGKQHALGC